MFQPVSAPRFPTRLLAVSALIHAAGILVLLVLGFPEPPSTLLPRPLHVALLAPRLEPYHPTRVRTPELKTFLPPPARVFRPVPQPVLERPLAATPVALPEVLLAAVEIPRGVLPPRPVFAAPIRVGTFAEAQTARPILIHQIKLVAGFEPVVPSRFCGDGAGPRLA